MSAGERRQGLGVRAKLIGLLIGTAFVALLLACGSFVYYDRVSSAAAKHDTLRVLVASVSNSAFGPTAFQDAESSGTILKTLASEPTALTAAIYMSDGERLAVWMRDGVKQRLPAKLDAAPKDGYAKQWLQVTSPIAQPGTPPAGTLRVLFSTDDLAARTQRFLQIAGSVLIISVLLAALCASLAHKLLTRPVSILAEAAKRVQEQKDFNVRAERISNDELGSLTDAFNAMLAMIQARDQELSNHRQHLEELVAARTRDLDARNQEMRLVLDTVDQGFVTLDRDGCIGPERSAAFDAWFGEPAKSASFAAHLAQQAPAFETNFTLLWTQLQEGILPLELNLAQLPARIHTRQDRHYELAYRPIQPRDEQFDKLLVVVTDVTARTQKERADADQAQIMAMFENITNDRGGFTEFLEEAERLVAGLVAGPRHDRDLVLRELHTLKGNCSLFQLVPLAKLVHDIESACIDSGEEMSDEQREELRQAWARFVGKARGYLGHHPNTLTVEQSELESLCDALRAGRPASELIRMVGRLTDEPVAPKLARMGDRARTLAKRLGKGALEVEIQASGVRAPPGCSWLWHVLPHAVNNSVDHGLRDAAEQQARSQPAKLRLAAAEHGGELVIEIEDNGRGIDWQRVRAKAEKLGMRAPTDADLERVLFQQGFSTRDEATQVSGRGVGLSALAQACREHGAQINLVSRTGSGALLRLTLTKPANTNHSFRPHTGAA